MKGNKLFVKSMIITAVLSITTLMIIMFIGIRYYLDQTPKGQVTQEGQVTEGPKVPFNSTILGIVKYVNETEIQVFDIEKKQEVTAIITATTKIKDNYGKIMPLEDVEIGDVIQLVYEPNEEQLLEINGYTSGWVKSDMKNVGIDRSNRQIKIGQNTYFFTNYTLMLDSEGKPTDIYNIGDYDVLQLKGIGQDIYSIRVQEQQGYIQLEGLPSTNGVVEIDVNRQLPLSSTTSPVPVTAGEHKITVQLEGYAPKTQVIEVKSGDTLVLTMDDLERSYTALKVEILNPDLDYTIKVGQKLFTKTDEIRVESGEYRVEIKAPGHVTWVQTMSLSEPSMTLQLLLSPLPGTEENQQSGDNTNNTNNQTGNNNQTTNPNNNSHEVSISTEPAGADVYINGKYEGITPYTGTLAIGDYSVRLKKEGYADYETRILVDNTNSQNKYLYMLIAE